MQESFIYDTLTQPVTKAERQEYLATNKKTIPITASFYVFLIAVLVVAPTTIIFLIGIIVTVVSSNADAWIGIVLAIFVSAPTVVLIGIPLSIYLKQRRAILNRSIHIWKFARQNNLTYTATTPGQPGGLISRNKSFNRLRNVITNAKLGSADIFSADSMNFEIGEYYCRTDKEVTDGYAQSYGYMKIPLAGQLPNMYLDAKSNNLRILGIDFTKMIANISGGQKIVLEGDFNSVFTLYAPEDYAVDARYIFTPDLMALLMDTAGAYDVEIVGMFMNVYSNKPFDMTKPQTMHRLIAIHEIVAAKLMQKSTTYQDDRTTVTQEATSRVTVAAQGQYIKTGIRLTTVFSIIAGSAFMIWITYITVTYYANGGT